MTKGYTGNDKEYQQMLKNVTHIRFLKNTLSCVGPERWLEMCEYAERQIAEFRNEANHEREKYTDDLLKVLAVMVKWAEDGGHPDELIRRLRKGDRWHNRVADEFERYPFWDKKLWT